MPSENERLTKQFTFRVSDSEHASIEAIAKRDERKPADVVRRIFRKGLTRELRKAAK